MKQTKNPIIITLAIIGACAVLYGAWRLYGKHEVAEHSRAMFAAPAPSGLPDIFHNASPSKQP